MEERTLRLTAEQYRLLIQALELAVGAYYALATSSPEEFSARHDDVDSLQSALLSQAAMFDSSDIMENVEGVPIVVEGVEAAAMAELDAYDEDVFWRMLAEQLARLELSRKYDLIQAAKLGPQKLHAEQHLLEEKYDRLLHEKGFAKVVAIRQDTHK